MSKQPLKHPIPETKAKQLAVEWFDTIVPLLALEAGKECLHTAPAPTNAARKAGEKSAPDIVVPYPTGVKTPTFPTFSAVEPAKIEAHMKTPSGKGDPPYTTILKAIQSSDGTFLVVAALHVTDHQKGPGGPMETVYNPLVYVVETVQRDRPSGWGRFQPYGKRVDVQGGLTRNVPVPDPVKAVKNISARVVQKALSADQPQTPVDVSFRGQTVPNGVHVFPDTSNRGHFIIHIAAKVVSEASVVAILQILANESVPETAVPAHR